MGLFASLNVGVSGLNAQSDSISTISDNIANANTVGYKTSLTNFSDLINDSSAILYAAQGVMATNTQLVSGQGLIQHTSSPTDLAVSGSGLFVVNTLSNSTGQVEYTRAGSFTPDANGNYQNAAGLFLQGWLLDDNGKILTPNTLQTINVLNVTSAPVATSSVSIGANLNSTQTLFTGSGVTASIDPVDGINAGIGAMQLIVPNAADHIRRGDQFSITDTPPSPALPATYTYTYGGYTVGRNVTDPSSAGDGDNGVNLLASPVALTNPFQTVGSGSGDVIVTVPSTTGLATGDVVSFSGASAVGGITAAQLTGKFVITVLSPTTYQITTTGSDPAVGGTSGGGSVSETVRPYAGAIFDASAANQAFLGATGISGIVPAALSFSITTAATGTVNFTYTAAAPNPQLRQFNNLNNLADAINSVNGLTARVVNGRLYVGALDATAAVTFANGQSAGASGPPVLSGLDWVGELGLSNISAGTNRFSTLSGLASVVNASPGLSATVLSPGASSTVKINAISPLDSISMSDRAIPAAVPLAANAYSTSAGSNIVTITATVPPPGIQVGDVITLSGLAPGTYDGIPDTALNGSFVVQSVGVGNFTIAAGVAPGTVTAGTFGAGTEQLQPAANAGSILDELDIPTLAAPVTLAANAYSTAAGSNTVTISATTTPPLQPGNIITLSGLAAGTYDGIPDTALNGTFAVQSVSAGSFTITANVAPGTVTAGTFGAGTEQLQPPNVAASLNGNPLTSPVPSTGTLGPAYVPTNNFSNMASGAVSPQFTRQITVYDSTGAAHTLSFGFIKTAVNTWAVEIYVPAADITGSTNGQLAFGTVTFNGDGTLSSVSPSLTGAIAANWSTTGALPGAITFNLGTAGPISVGKSDGLSQIDNGYDVNFVKQNGFPAGELSNVSVDSTGHVIGTFNTGESRSLYQIPLAQFASPDNLQAVTGNAYLATNQSGAAVIDQAGANGVGTIGAAELESSTTDLGSQLTRMIVAQQAYQANTKLITTSDSMLQTATQMLT